MAGSILGIFMAGNICGRDQNDVEFDPKWVHMVRMSHTAQDSLQTPCNLKKGYCPYTSYLHIFPKILSVCGNSSSWNLRTVEEQDLLWFDLCSSQEVHEIRHGS